MAVFPFPNVIPQSSSLTFESNTEVHVSPLSGAIQTLDRGGERWRLLLNFANQKDADRARLQALPTQLNGQEHRLSVPDHSYTKQGSLTVTELVTNSDFSDGVNNWKTGSGAEIFAVINGLRTHQSGTIKETVRPTAAITTVAGKSYAFAVDFLNGYFPTESSTYALRAGITEQGSEISSVSGSVTNEKHSRVVLAITAVGTSTWLAASRNSGDWDGTYDINRASFARALLVDNGFNALTKSSEFDHSDWIKTNATVSADAAAAQDGTTTADEFIENSDTGQIHGIEIRPTRASVAEYWTGSVVIEENTRQRIRLLVDDLSLNGAFQYFDANSGTETATVATTGTGSNPYSSIHSLGSGLYLCRVSVLIPASTTVRLQFQMCQGATNVVIYNGDGTSGIYLSEAQLQRGGQLGRRTPTTTAGILGTSQTGNEIWLKGLDPHTNAQLKAGDQMEINGQLVMLIADLDGDESGVGLARVMPKIRTAPADEDPVVLHRPMGKFLLAKPANTWSNQPGVFSGHSFEFIEDIA